MTHRLGEGQGQGLTSILFGTEPFAGTVKNLSFISSTPQGDGLDVEDPPHEASLQPRSI